MIRTTHLALVFRVVALLFVFTGVMSHMGVCAGSFHPRSLMYYTIQSNILAVLLFMLLVWASLAELRQGDKGRIAGSLARFEMVCVVDLLLTFVVYWALLASGEKGALMRFDNLAVHFLSPMLCLIDYVLFTVPGYSRRRDVYAALIFPLSYMVYTSAAGYSGYTYGIHADGSPRHFPYFFLDFEMLGATSLLYIGLVAGMLIAIGYGVYLIDHKARRSISC